MTLNNIAGIRPSDDIDEIQQWIDEATADVPDGDTVKAEAEAGIMYWGIKRLAKECWSTAEDHGWHENIDPRMFVEKIALIHSEASEALEEYRDGHGFAEVYYNGDKPEGVPVELADIIIRTLDLAEIYSIDLPGALFEKMMYNETREYRHGGKKA